VGKHPVGRLSEDEITMDLVSMEGEWKWLRIVFNSFGINI
jgi:hypothetical protein